MKSLFYRSIRCFVSSIAILLPAVSDAQDQYDPYYSAWVGNVHEWIGKTYIEGEGYEPYWYYMDGDTVIADKTYYKIYGINRRIYGDWESHYYASYRYEDYKTFCIYKDDTEEYMWADFTMETGDTWVTPDLKDTPELCIKVLHHVNYEQKKPSIYSPRYLVVALFNQETGEIVSSPKCLYEFAGDIHNFATKNSWDEDENNEFLLFCNTSAGVNCARNRNIESARIEIKAQGFHLKQPRKHTR